MLTLTLAVMRRMYADEAAALAGIARGTWTTYASRRLPKGNPVPQPDGVDIEAGHARPWWKESTVRRWMAARPGSPGRPRDAVSMPAADDNRG